MTLLTLMSMLTLQRICVKPNSKINIKLLLKYFHLVNNLLNRKYFYIFGLFREKYLYNLYIYSASSWQNIEIPTACSLEILYVAMLLYLGLILSYISHVSQQCFEKKKGLSLQFCLQFCLQFLKCFESSCEIKT